MTKSNFCSVWCPFVLRLGVFRAAFRTQLERCLYPIGTPFGHYSYSIDFQRIIKGDIIRVFF